MPAVNNVLVVGAGLAGAGTAIYLAAAGVAVDLEQVETNFVQIDVGPLGLSKAEAVARLADEGVGVSATAHPTVLRAVTHLDVDDDAIDRALDAIPRALGVLARV